jgi:hypothetical protein
MEIEASLNDNAFGPKVSNITLKREAGKVPEVGDNQVDAFQFKREGNGEYSNIIIDGYGNFTTTTGTITTFKGSAVSILDAATNDHQVKTSKIKLLNVKITNTTNINPIGATDAIVVAFPTGTFVTSTTATGATLTPGAWATVDGVNLIK